MTIFIAHVEADQAAAEDLRAYLKTRGQMAELETGERGFRHLGPMDAVVALWSSQSVFGRYRMMFEKRMLDAWADQQLVLVKLDHGFLPVGLRDQKAVDASFEASRKLTGWPEVERAAREAVNRALAAREPAPAPPSPNPSGPAGAPPGGGTLGDRVRAASPPQAQSQSSAPYGTPMPKARAKSSGMMAPITLLAAAGALGWALWRYVQHPGLGWAQYLPEIGVSALAVVLVLRVLSARVGVRMRKSAAPVGNAPLSKMDAPIADAPKGSLAAKLGEAKKAEASAPAGADAAPATDTAVFISYAHADNGQVEPVVKIVEANGREVWIDRQGIQAGEGWAGEIVRAIRGAKGVMVMCSPRAFESDHIKREVYLADRYKKPMLPVFLEQANMPDDFEFFFAGVQWLELFKLPEADRETAIRNALASI